jgi:Spy/CpxP family protein refolding chaperone
MFTTLFLAALLAQEPKQPEQPATPPPAAQPKPEPKPPATQPDKPDEVKTPTRLRGFLPSGWKKLALTDDQKQRIYRVQQEYDDKVAALEAQIRALKAEEKAKLYDLLTPAQRALLKEPVPEPKVEPEKPAEPKK